MIVHVVRAASIGRSFIRRSMAARGDTGKPWRRLVSYWPFNNCLSLLSVQLTVGKYETGFIPTNSGNGGRVRAARGELDVLRGRLSLHEGTQQHKLFLNIIQFSI